MKTTDVKTFKQLKDKEKKEMKAVNMKTEKADVRIDRPYILGNPFKITAGVNREQSLKQYKRYLWNCIQVVDALNELAEMPDKTTLGCHCKPLPCHGDVVLKAVEYLKARKAFKPSDLRPKAKAKAKAKPKAKKGA
ncbi:MAG TPA: DUF4326 domain-containing protein [Desulfosporosinus sp.]|nr:DUF4326 domain-containing protein [Desulfosporosinus sp.]